MDQPIIDPTLGLKSSVWALLHMLGGYDLTTMEGYDSSDTLFSRTCAFYCGRESGIVIWISGCRVKPNRTANLFVRFGECGGTDQMFVEYWTSNRLLTDPPTAQDKPSSAFETRKIFPWGDAGRTVQAIRAIVQMWLKSGGMFAFKGEVPTDKPLRQRAQNRSRKRKAA